MAEYIEREALIADIEKRYCRPCEAEGKDYNHVRCRACWVDDMVGEIEEAPDADVVPVVHGQWIYKNGRIVCDQCETVYAVCPNRDDAKELMNEMKGFEKFCFNCGAHMKDGE